MFLCNCNLNFLCSLSYSSCDTDGPILKIKEDSFRGSFCGYFQYCSRFHFGKTYLVTASTKNVFRAVTVTYGPHNRSSKATRYTSSKLLNTIWRILLEGLSLKAYKVQLVEGLIPTDLPNYNLCSCGVLDKLAKSPMFSIKICSRWGPSLNLMGASINKMPVFEVMSNPKMIKSCISFYEERISST